MSKKLILTLLSGSLLATGIYAQNKFTVSGFVREEYSAESLPGAIIKVKDSETFVSTNEYGYYAISLNPGTYTFQLYYPGYSDTSFSVNIGADNQKIDLLINPTKAMQEVEVIAKAKNAQDVRSSTHQLTSEQVKNIPALLGEKDVFKVVKLLPGVQKGQEGSSGFNVRGGGTDQNLIILDDAVVYNASHLFGFISVFNGDALKGIELIKGGYPAKYGERLSSVLNITMKDGDKQKYKGEIGLGLLSSRATLEGPIVKNKASFLISARRSYADVIASPIIKMTTDGVSAGAYFYDLNAKVNYQINENNSLFLSGYFGRDRFYSRENYDDSRMRMSFGWGNATGTLRWNHIFNPKLFANMTLNYSNYNMAVNIRERYDGQDYKMSYISAIDDIGGKYDLSYFLSSNNTIRAGYKLTHHLFRPNAFVEIDNGVTTPNANKEYVSWEQNLYVDDEWKISKRLAANLGLRGSAFTSRDKTYYNIEPRVSARFLIDDQTSIKASYTIMNQYMHLLTSTGINLPTDLWVPATSRVAPQRATQYSLGLFRDFEKPGLSLSVEGYYKDMTNIISYREGASFLSLEEPGNTDPNKTFEDQITSGIGKSYGAEMMLQKQKGKFSGWVAYTLSWTKYRFNDVNNGEWFYPRFDRRHDVNVVGFYELTPRIKLNALFTFATGNPISLAKQTGAVIENIPTTGNLAGTTHVYNTSIFSGRNEYRTEVYHRLDLGIQFSKEKRKGTRTWEISFYNIYNRRNPFFYTMEWNNAGTSQGVYKYTIFPFIPSFTYSFKFK